MARGKDARGAGVYGMRGGKDARGAGVYGMRGGKDALGAGVYGMRGGKEVITDEQRERILAICRPWIYGGIVRELGIARDQVRQVVVTKAHQRRI